MNPRDYNISIRRVLVDEDQLFEARIRELPDVTEYADTMEEAYELALDTIETTARFSLSRAGHSRYLLWWLKITAAGSRCAYPNLSIVAWHWNRMRRASA